MSFLSEFHACLDENMCVNRWGYMQAFTPEKTMEALETKLPREHWIDVNRLLVPLGKHIFADGISRKAQPIKRIRD